jgi:hypothetical protein
MDLVLLPVTGSTSSNHNSNKLPYYLQYPVMTSSTGLGLIKSPPNMITVPATTTTTTTTATTHPNNNNHNNHTINNNNGVIQIDTRKRQKLALATDEMHATHALLTMIERTT